MIIKLRSSNNKKAQSWYMDFIIAITVIIIIGVIFVKLIVDFSQETGVTQELIDEAKNIGNALMNPGYRMIILDPTFDLEKELIVGITDDTNNQKTDLSKIERLRSYINSKYGESKILLGIRADYFVYIEDKDGNIKISLGYPLIMDANPQKEMDVNTKLASLKIKNLGKLSRIVCYDTSNGCKFSKMVILTW